METGQRCLLFIFWRFKMNWKKIVETTLSVGVAVAASIIGDKFVAKAAKSITTKDDAEDYDEPIDVEVNDEEETVKETEEEETEG